MQILNLQPVEEKQPPHKLVRGKPEAMLIEGDMHDHLSNLQHRCLAFLLQPPP